MKWKVPYYWLGAARGKLRMLLAALCSVVLLTAAACTAGNSPGSSGKTGDGAGSGGTGSATATAFRWGSYAWAASISNNPYSPTPAPDLNLALMGLGGVSDWGKPGSNPYEPEIAKSWDIAAHSITFHLQPNAKWQDGTPLTSKDVVTSFEVAGMDYNAVWAAMSKVQAPDSHTVVVDLQTWAVPQNVLLHLLQLNIVPAAEYGQFVAPKADEVLATYWKEYNILKPTAATIANAGNSAAGKTMGTFSGRLVKYNPKTLNGNGAYQLQSENISGVLYKKWDGWWDAAKITAPYVQILPMDVSTQYESVLSGSADFVDDTELNDVERTALMSSGHSHYTNIPSPVQQVSMVPNFNHYPFNLVQVRQALEYLINRPDIVKRDTAGTFVQTPPEATPDGINFYEASQFINSGQFAQLNHYNPDTNKAAQLLQSVGFKKVSGKWITPKGQPFSFTISEQSGVPYFDEDGLVVAGELKAFGIGVSVEDVDAATYGTKMLNGDFAMSETYMDWGQGSPMADFAASFGEPANPAYNYPIAYSGKGPCNCAIGIGPRADVPGLGNVNIAAELNREVNQDPPSKWAADTWDWAQWFNQNLPFLPIYNNAFHEVSSQQRYTDFPPDSAKWLWTGLTGVSQPVEWMQAGYLKLK